MKWAGGGYSWKGDLDKTWMGAIGDIPVFSSNGRVIEALRGSGERGQHGSLAGRSCRAAGVILRDDLSACRRLIE